MNFKNFYKHIVHFITNMPPFRYSLTIEERFLNRCFNPILDIIKRYNAELTGTIQDANGFIICFQINPLNSNFNPDNVNDLFDYLKNNYPYIINFNLYYQLYRQRHYTCDHSNMYYTETMRREDDEEKDDF